MYIAYILQSSRDGKYYIGSTDNIEKRIIKHNKGYSRYTKNRGPFNLAYREDFSTRSGAKKREYHLKSLKSKVAIENLIKQAAIV